MAAPSPLAAPALHVSSDCEGASSAPASQQCSAVQSTPALDTALLLQLNIGPKYFEVHGNYPRHKFDLVGEAQK